MQECYKRPSQLQSLKTCGTGFMGTAVSAIDVSARMLPGSFMVDVQSSGENPWIQLFNL